ncbi:MAG: hypothetical protein HQL06_05965 [Nitrospirae bacterium]|nr:hypothetical protein [Nitrospirota bacterium]
MATLRYLMCLLALGLCLNGVVFANDAQSRESNSGFEERKAKIVENVDKRIKVMQDFKSCVSAAKDRGALKKCMQDRKQAMQQLRPTEGRSRE